jgi:ribosomal protein S18 acetylase RimI-like enzyme
VNGRAVRIAALTPDDWRELKTLRLEAFRSEPAAFSTSYDEALARTDEEWRDQLADPRRVVLLAWASQRPVGMVGAYRGADDGGQSIAIVFGMYVNREFRRQGVGRGLLASLIDLVSGFPEIATIRLWVTEEQESARRLYESAGFQIVGQEVQNRQGDGRLHDELVMERPVR